MSELDDYTFNGKKNFVIADACTHSGGREKEKDAIVKKTSANLERLALFQAKLYADARESLLIVLQALDAAGKDSTIKHVMSTINPQGVDVFGFRTPNLEEASHDFLWRYHSKLPARGKISIFNRSYYEEVLVVNVHEYFKEYRVPARMLRGGYINQKYKDIRNWEKYLYGNGIKVVKIFLNLSKNEQQKRFLERIDKPEKNWKFSSNDIKERAYFERYQKAYEDAINNTATRNCPWFVLPADQKWYTRYLVSEILLQALTDIDPQFPELDEEEAQHLQDCRTQLADER